jgi:hypothetical protein
VFHHVLLHRLKVMMHVLLGMLLLQRGNEWGDKLRAHGALPLTALRGELLHALALLLHNRTEFLQDKVLTLFQILVLGLTEVLYFLWRHWVATAHGNEHDVTQRARLDGKSLGRHHHSSGSP